VVIVRLWGGLGNQLFQYAAGFAAARKADTSLLLDPLRCDLDVNRPYELHHFKISGRPWTAREKKWAERMVRVVRPVNGQTSGWSRCLKAAVTPLMGRWFKYVEDQYRGFQPGALAHQGHMYLAGTWASERYFEQVAGSIREQFTLVAPPGEENERMLDRIGSCNAVCLHVRRGDYVSVRETSQRHGTCGLDYYRAALEYIASRTADPVVFVFSDDPAWVRENLRLPRPTVYVTHNVGKRNHEDLRLMSACRHFIIANSSFSWWGAWLAEAEDKMVIAPKRWNIATAGMDDPAPSHWVRL